jgi:hypothetical protein
MTGGDARHWWPTSQRLIVITSDTPGGASTWIEALDDLMASSRDVIDEWHELCDDQPGITLRDDLDGLAARIESLRRALFVVRQWEVPDD